ncbi:MAG: hypothetical protein ACR2PK_07325 [Acidimicrobiales bacterium]
MGRGSAVESVKRFFDDGPLAGFAGVAGEVAETLSSWEQKGFTDCMLGEFVPGSIDALAGALVWHSRRGCLLHE